ncbi:MAG TPA: transcription termination/antitermination protein NusA [Actinobacteria bacterium]|nr:transcription termination/antitermination protein NusA [Actinomycetes bacterium]HEX21108.1 transcription termination/antitermination protein NusA [Actinomycetota bacterium]
MNSELIEALRQLEREKKISAQTILDALEQALAVAYKRNHPEEDEIQVSIDPESGEITAYAVELSGEGEEAKVVSRKEISKQDIGRIAAQTAKQVIQQRIREAERELMFDEYIDREGDIVTGIVQQSDQRYTLVNLGQVEALLPIAEQVHNERYDHGMRIKAYIVEVRRTSKEPQIIVSRSHPGLLKRLFELEVPEIYDGFVEIKSVAREPGYRSKIAVASNDKDVDPVGACVGPKGSRVRMVVMELKGEKIDVVQYSDDPAKYVANALSPAQVKEVKFNDGEQTALVIVPDNQLSLAIGKEGQNARLAAKLTGWRIDIKSETKYAEELLSPVVEEKPTGKETADQCEAIKSNGERCGNKAKPNSKYCGLAAHKKLGEAS